MTAVSLLTVAQVAARLHVSEAAVYRLLRTGELPGATRVGRSWRVDPRRLDAALFGAPCADTRAGAAK